MSSRCPGVVLICRGSTFSPYTAMGEHTPTDTVKLRRDVALLTKRLERLEGILEGVAAHLAKRDPELALALTRMLE